MYRFTELFNIKYTVSRKTVLLKDALGFEYVGSLWVFVSPGIEPGYIVFPSHKTMYIFNKAYCYLCGK
jgi:hypothetical protein